MAEVKVYRPEELDRDQWRDLQVIELAAFVSAFVNRSLEEIGALVAWDEPARFMASHIDPNTEVGRRYNYNNLFAAPRVAVATESNKAIGFAYSARNVSGGGPPEGPQNNSLRAMAERHVKRLSIVKNYLWVRELVVAPEDQYHRKGIGKSLGRALLQQAIALQPVSAYVWPDEDEGLMKNLLEKYGFAATGEQSVHVFGEDSDPATQVRMQAPSARAVLKRLN